MNKILALALLAAGIVFIVLGVQATNSLNSDVSRVFASSATDNALWMLVGGILASIAGLVWMLGHWKPV